MKVKEVSCRRVFNLGNYETYTVEVVSVVDEGENPQDVLKKKQ